MFIYVLIVVFGEFQFSVAVPFKVIVFYILFTSTYIKKHLVALFFHNALEFCVIRVYLHRDVYTIRSRIRVKVVFSNVEFSHNSDEEFSQWCMEELQTGLSWPGSKHGTTFHIPVERFIYGTVASLSDVQGEK